MSGMIRRRLLKLEQEAKAKEIAISQEIQYAVFDAVKISDDDRKLLNAIVDRGELRRLPAARGSCF